MSLVREYRHPDRAARAASTGIGLSARGPLRGGLLPKPRASVCVYSCLLWSPIMRETRVGIRRGVGKMMKPIKNLVQPWLWSMLFAPARQSFSFEVSELVSVGEPARLHVWLQGASDFVASPDHHVRLYVNGGLVGETSWDGKLPHKMEADVWLQEGTNPVSYTHLRAHETQPVI